MRTAALLITAALVLGVAGCGGSSSTKTTKTAALHATGALGPLKVTIVPVTWGIGPPAHGKATLNYTVTSSRDGFAKLQIAGRAGPGSIEQRTVPLKAGSNPEFWRGYVDPSSTGVTLTVSGYTDDGARDTVVYNVPLDRSRKGP